MTIVKKDLIVNILHFHKSAIAILMIKYALMLLLWSGK